MDHNFTQQYLTRAGCIWHMEDWKNPQININMNVCHDEYETTTEENHSLHCLWYWGKNLIIKLDAHSIGLHFGL